MSVEDAGPSQAMLWGGAVGRRVLSYVLPFIFVATVWATRFISLGSIMATLALGPIALALGASSAVVGAACVVALLIVFRHRANIGRLLAGTERRIGQKAAL